MKKRRFNQFYILPILIFILSIAIFVYSIIDYAYIEQGVKTSFETYGLVGAFILSGLLEFIPQYISPHIFVISGALFDFNFLRLLFVVIIGSTIGSVLGFEVGHRFKRRASILEKWIGKKRAQRFERGINKQGRIFITLAAVSPIPYIPLILGMMHLSRKNFVLYGIIPRIIGLVIMSSVFGIL